METNFLLNDLDTQPKILNDFRDFIGRMFVGADLERIKNANDLS